MKSIFKTIDINKNGEISYAEVQSIIKEKLTSTNDTHLINPIQFNSLKNNPINFETFWNSWVETAGNIF